MFLDTIYIVLLQTLAASIYAVSDSYHRCRACMCGRDYYAYIHVAMGYSDLSSILVCHHSRPGGYQTRAADRSNYSDPHVYHGTLERHAISMALRVDCGSRMLLYNRLLYGGYIAHNGVPVDSCEELYPQTAEVGAIRWPKL